MARDGRLSQLNARAVKILSDDESFRSSFRGCPGLLARFRFDILSA